jgi:hypothetical protein
MMVPQTKIPRDGSARPARLRSRAVIRATALGLLVLGMAPQSGAAQSGGAQGGGGVQGEPGRTGSAWFPEARLFQGPLADPLEPGFRGAAVRSNLLRGGIPGAERRLPRLQDLGPEGEDWQGIVSFGETLPIRTLADWGTVEGADPQGVQLAVLVGVTARFRLATARNEYLASDWVVGLPLEMARGAWTGRALLYHRSAHLGDELIESAGVRRVGYGHEGLQILTGHRAMRWGGDLRLYAGGSHLFRSETSGTLSELGLPQRDRWEAQGGFELQRALPDSARRGPRAGLGLSPIIALDLKASERTQWQPQWSALAGLSFEARTRSGLVALRWIHGPSMHGEFFLRPESALGLEFRLSP